jgi:predicted metal-dependent HD superfamily phosphohydrolase
MLLMNFLGAKNYIFNRLQKELSPNLYFHSLDHSLDVLRSACRLNCMEEVNENDSILIETAAIYHDSGMITTYLDHEAASAKLAREVLPQFEYSPKEIEIIESLIMVTTMPQSANTKLEKVICDADLDALGREDFFITSFQLQLEWKLYGIMNSTLAEWIRFEIDFMEKHNYFTSSAINLREVQKQKNIKVFKDLLKI